jgi:hypothetical protein
MIPTQLRQPSRGGTATSGLVQQLEVGFSNTLLYACTTTNNQRLLLSRLACGLVIACLLALIHVF